MKLNRVTGALLLLLVGCIVPAFAQPNEAERKQFDALRAKADKGDQDSQLAVAFCYANGTGVARDTGKSAKYLRKAAEQGMARAQCLLGLRYANGEGVKQDKTEAARWLRRAADQGLPEAQFDLGMCYVNGEGVQASLPEAVDLYRKAAEQGLPDAQCELGTCYLEGTGVPKDIPTGVKWTRESAEQGFARAQNALGTCYLKGTGVAKNNVEAYKWFNLAAASGGQLADDARVNLAAAQRYLTPEQIEEAQRMGSEFKPFKGPPEKESPTASGKTNAPATASGLKTPGVASSNTGFVNVKADNDSYEVYVDGAFFGNTPAKVKLTAGNHLIEVKRSGFKDYQKEIRITEGSELSLRAVLEKK